MSDKKPIHQLYVGLATIMEIGQKPAGVTKQGKSYPAKIYVEVKTEDNRWMAIDFKRGNEFDDKKLKKLITYFKLEGVKQLPSIKGQQLAIFVAPGEWQDKVFWNVKDFFDPKYLKDPLEAAFDSFDEPGKKDADMGELGF